MNVRKRRITTRIFIYISLVVLLGDIILGIALYNKTSNVLIEQISNNARDLAICAAGSINAEEFENVLTDGAEAEEFEKIKNTLSAFLNAKQLQYVYSFAKDEEGKTYFAIDTDKEDPADFGEIYLADEVMNQAFNGQAIADTEPSSDEWGTYLSAYAPIINGSKVLGIVGVDVDYSNVSKQKLKIALFILLLCTIVYILLFICLKLICAKVSIGLNTLNNKVKELCNGSGDISKKIEITTGDEFETIGENFNTFIGQIGKLVDNVAEVSQVNDRTIKNLNQNVLMLHANMEECSATSETVSSNISSIASQTLEFSDQISQVNQFVSDKSENARRQAKSAKEHKENAQQTINTLNNEMEQALKQAESIEQVQSVVGEINAISMQTRILSMNARIEASRAGAAGKGFSVVAAEIAELSGQTEEAVKKIENINLDVQEAMKNLNISIDKMVEFITSDVSRDYDDYLELGTEFGKTTDLIADKMAILDESSAMISEKLSYADTSVADISKAVNDSASQLEKVSVSADRISKSMDRLLENKMFK